MKKDSINRVYRVVWNASKSVWQAVCETGKAHGKEKSSRSLRRAITVAGIALAGGALAAPAANELPTGGNVVAGNATISTSGARMDVLQTSQHTAIDWNTFNIGSAAHVHFEQPSGGVALNRVLDTNASQIYGRLTATGQVFLLNPNGVLFAPGAQVDVGGIVASTLNLGNADFMAGNYTFSGSSSNAIVNQGNITIAPGGTVALIAARITNTGSIEAPQGSVLLGAGSRVTLDLGGPVKLQVEQGAVDALIESGGAIKAADGLIYLTARSADTLTQSVINHSGIIEANSLSAQGGKVVLESDQILLADGSQIDASGATGGGQVLVGGGWQGTGGYYQATTVTMQRDASIDVSAKKIGSGGTAVLWSDIHNADSQTRAYGTIWAMGGAEGGDGGRIETSGHWLSITGSRGGASADLGKAGLWLLDPYNVTITSADANGAWGGGNPDIWTPNANNSTILNTDIASKLESGTNVTVTTGSAGTQIGDITVASAITKASGNADVTLTLQAANSIVIDQAISNTGGTGKLHVVLDADNDNGTRNGGGITILNNNITTGGGNISFGTGATLNIGGVNTKVGGDVYVGGSGALALNTAGGDVTVNGEMLIANTNGFSINTSNGNVNFGGLVNSANQYSFINKTASAGTGTWDAARIEARDGTTGGSAIGDKYLVTITSRLENALATRATGYVGAWIGAYRPDYTTGAWQWADGPEGGQTFFNQSGLGGGTTVSGYFSNFDTGEPNGAFNASGETRGQFFGTQGLWNDLTNGTTYSNNTTNQYAVLGFVRETNLAASPLTVDAGTGTVTFTQAVGNSKALASLNVTGSTIAINGGAVTSGDQTYTATGNVTQGGAITATGLLLLGANGNYNLTNTGNNVATLAANTGSMNFYDTNGLTIGTLGATNGITATNGAVVVETGSGDITISQNVSASDTGTSAILINAGKTAAAGTATGGNIVLSGTRTFTTGAGGRTILYSGDSSASTGLSSLVSNAGGTLAYNADEASTPTPTSGIHAIYRGPAPAVTSSTPDIPKDTAVSTAQGTATQPVITNPLTTNATSPNELPTADISGGLAFVEVNSTQGTGGGDTTNVQSTNDLPSGTSGRDPLGFMRIFVVNGGINLPAVAFGTTGQRDQNDANQ